jgi:hypothetical protein
LVDVKVLGHFDRDALSLTRHRPTVRFSTSASIDVIADPSLATASGDVLDKRQGHLTK